MSFIWPPMLLSLLLLPAGLAIYAWVSRRRQRLAAVYGRAGTTQGATGPAGAVLRWMPPVLIIAGLATMLLATARPQAVVSLPRVEGTVILAFDVSGSMAATDMTPTRMDAAKAAARTFVASEPPTVSIGIVAFSDAGISAQVPTNDRATIDSAIDRLTPQKGTSVGEGITASLKAIAAANAGPWVDYYTNASAAPTASPTPVPSGTYTSAAIILLTDGENNESPDPMTAAHAAADRGVRIYTVGIGTAAGTNVNLKGFTVHTQLDQATLQQIAQVTGGTYFSASDAGQLQTVYADLSTALVGHAELTEVTAIFAGVSLLLLLIGASTSLLWQGRLP